MQVRVSLVTILLSAWMTVGGGASGQSVRHDTDEIGCVLPANLNARAVAREARAGTGQVEHQLVRARLGRRERDVADLAAAADDVPSIPVGWKS